MKLTNTVTNITKNNKGFSLLEVLVGVSIIGIISAIAVPTYQNYTKEASKTAANTTISNIAKSYTSCLILKPFAQCNDLPKIGISCSDCDSGASTSAPNIFCGMITKNVAGEDFKACVSISGTAVTKTYGGILNKICHVTYSETSSSDCSNAGHTLGESALSSSSCDTKTDCPADDTTSACKSVHDCKSPTTAGDCAPSTGLCS